MRGQFVPEGSTASDTNPTPAFATLTPIYVTVPLRFSKQEIASMSAANFAEWTAKAIGGLEEAGEFKAFQQLTGITALSTVSGSSLYTGVLAQQEAVLRSGSAYIFSKTTYSKGLQKKRSSVAADGLAFVIDNQSSINGIPAVRSAILSDVAPNNIIYVISKDLVIASWGAVSLEYVVGEDQAMKGEVLVVASWLMDAKVINPASFARISNGHQLS